MRLILDSAYSQLLSASKAFGLIGPVFYNGTATNFNICVITNGGKNRVQGNFNPQPSTFFTDFPSAVEVDFSQLSDSVTRTS
jgi:hypothetical protein